MEGLERMNPPRRYLSGVRINPKNTNQRTKRCETCDDNVDNSDKSYLTRARKLRYKYPLRHKHMRYDWFTILLRALVQKGHAKNDTP